MITVRGVSKVFHSAAGQTSALRDIDLEIGRGELVAVVGKSGSGKSTLLNVIGGIDRPTSGSVIVDSTSLSSLDESGLTRWRGRNVGFVFQFFHLLPTLSALENVMLPMDFAADIPFRDRRMRAMELLERVDVASHHPKFPASLSGGEQQRVAIARALANDPSVVLADEPTGNLDSVTARAVVELLGELAANGKTVVVATHDAGLSRVANRSIEIADGRIARDTMPVSAAIE